jgi:uncharacterized membrane protein
MHKDYKLLREKKFGYKPVSKFWIYNYKSLQRVKHQVKDRIKKNAFQSIESYIFDYKLPIYFVQLSCIYETNVFVNYVATPIIKPENRIWTLLYLLGNAKELIEKICLLIVLSNIKIFTQDS